MTFLCVIIVFISLIFSSLSCDVKNNIQQSQTHKKQSPQEISTKEILPAILPDAIEKTSSLDSTESESESAPTLKDFKYSEAESNTQDASETMDLRQIWSELDISSEIWPQIIEMKSKEICVSRFIDLYAQQGIVIKKPAAYYAQMLDGLMRENPNILHSPFKDVLRFMAVVEYDFDNGMDRDQLARQLLGDGQFHANRKRLGLEK